LLAITSYAHHQGTSPQAPANHCTDRCPQLRKFGEHTRGISMSAVTFTVTIGACKQQVLIDATSMVLGPLLGHRQAVPRLQQYRPEAL